MANFTTNQPGSLLYREDLFYIPELLSRKTALTIVIVLSISLLWQWYQRRKFYRGLVSKPLSAIYLIPNGNHISQGLPTVFSLDICHP